MCKVEFEIFILVQYTLFEDAASLHRKTISAKRLEVQLELKMTLLSFRPDRTTENAQATPEVPEPMLGDEKRCPRLFVVLCRASEGWGERAHRFPDRWVSTHAHDDV